jgi:hypothetical protein
VSGIIAWAQANPEYAVAAVVYVIANFAPRPDHSDMSGWSRAFWQIIDRICLLTHDKAPGAFKLPLLDSPPKARVKAEAAEAPKPGDACRLCGVVEPEEEDDEATEDAAVSSPGDNGEDVAVDEAGEAEASDKPEQGAKT